MPKLRSQTNLITRDRAEPAGRDWISELGRRVQIRAGCWLVDGDAERYPRAGGNAGHRLVYEQVRNIKLDRTTEVHHTCEHPGCINPDHLVALSRAEHRAIHGLIKDNRRYVERNQHRIDAGQPLPWPEGRPTTGLD